MRDLRPAAPPVLHAGWRTRAAGAAAFALPLLLYYRTAAPTVYGVDSAELTTGAYLLGIVHPPGSPAYLLIGHLFTRLPFGDVGFRLNLLSVTAAAASCLLLFHIARHLTGQRAIALLISLVSAVTYYAWTSAVAAELYALHGCVMLALIALGLRWRATGEPVGFTRACGLAGFALGVHLAAVLLLPGVALLLLLPPRPTRASPPLLLGALAFLAGASVYAYVPLRHLAALPLNPARDYWQIDLASWSGFWWMVSGGGFRELFFAVPMSEMPEAFFELARGVWSNFLGVGALFGMVGLVRGLRQAPEIHLSLLVMVIGHLVFFLGYGAADKEVMNLPVLLIWAIWIAVGATAVGGWLNARMPGAGGWLVIQVGLGSLALLLLLINRPWVDLSQDRSARARGEAILGALAPDAVLVGSWSDLRVVEYLQHVEGRRLDVQPVDAFFSGTAERGRRIGAALETGRPVYVSTCRDLPDAQLQCERIAGCDCFRLRRPAS